MIPTRSSAGYLAVGVYYSPQFRAYTHKSVNPPREGYATFVFPVGQASVALLDRVFPMMFERALPVSGFPPLPVDSPKIAAVIEPKLENVTVVWPVVYCAHDANHAADITYRFTLYSENGEPVASWTVNGVGVKARSVTAGFPCLHSGSDTIRWLGEATDLAMLDAVTKLPDVFPGIPEVQQWLRGIGREEPR